LVEPTRTREEARWLKLAQAGDDAAFGRIVEAFQGPVFNLCYQMLGEREAAEDAAQETFLKAYRNLGRYDRERKFINWLLAIASNHCVDRLRKRRLQLAPLRVLDWSGRHSGDDPGPEAALAKAEDERTVHRLLSELGGLDRATIVLRYWHDLSYAEIAEVLGLTGSAVKSRLHRARNELATAWASSQGVPAQLEGEVG
jgi:RNA polymerase sigma-70 factor (ECF subfamily)